MGDEGGSPLEVTYQYLRGVIVCLAINRMDRTIQEQLIKSQIQPATEFKADLGKGSNVFEAKPEVQRNAADVGRIDSANHRMDVTLICRRDEMAHQHASQTPPTMILLDIHRMLHTVLVGRPGPKGSIAGKTQQQPGFVLSPDNRKSTCPLGIEPTNHALR